MSDTAATAKSAPARSLGQRLRPWIVWLCRILVGATFVFSGWSKSIDPAGFIIKINEYLTVWGIHWLWSQVVDTLAVALSVVEFTAGVLLLTGCLKRTVVWLVAAFMAVMLPLTAYIAIASPVDDCGCFGDALVISNNATFLKNVVLSAAVVYLLCYNRRVPGLYQPLMQWIVMVASAFYCLILAFFGLGVQPLADFRPYPIGTSLVDEDDADIQLLYSKDGETRAFDIDELPDSTWTYAGRVGDDTASLNPFAVFDGDEDVTADVIADEGPQLLLIVPDPSSHRKARASMANNLNDYVSDQGGSMIAVLGLGDVSLDEWRTQAGVTFDVYSGDDSVLESLVRGDAGLVYLLDGRIVWKRNLYSFTADFPDFTSGVNELDIVRIVDDGSYLHSITACYLGLLAVVLLLGLVRLRRRQS